jgi:hypothetical protein
MYNQSIPLGYSPMASIKISPDWTCGDIEILTAIAVVTAALNGDIKERNAAYALLQVVDLAVKHTVMILAGHQDSPSLARQQCAKSHHLVFSMGVFELAVI